MVINDIDLSKYSRIGRFDLPEPKRTTAPTNSALAQEVSAVTYNVDTDTLFVVGDGGTSIVQVSKTGVLIDSMTLAPGNSPQGTTFYDPEGLAYVGGGKFALVEERDRQVSLFTYTPNTTLTRANVQTVKLGTTIGNVGIEGITYDPQTSGFIAVKEITPAGIFQTTIDFAAGTASNGSPTAVNSTNLFDPAKAGLGDFADVYALSNVAALNGKADSGNLLVLSQADGKIVEVDRAGNVLSTLSIVSDSGNPLSLADQQHEGLTVDKDGNLYVVSENGGGSIDNPQLWVYAPSAIANVAPTALALNNRLTSIAENTSTGTPIKVADIAITDDALGTNTLSLTGADASLFEITGNVLSLKAGTSIDFETKPSYNVSVNVDDSTVGSTPDVTTAFTLAVTDVVNETLPVATGGIFVTEVAPWSSGNSPVAADWFELTNTGSSAVNISGWKFDDSSNAFASALTLNGITSIGAGESVVFIETSAATTATAPAAFLRNWFGTQAPAGLQIGTYTGSGAGLSTGGDAVNIYNAAGVLQTNLAFGASPAAPFATFNNAALQNNATTSTLSAVGTNGAFSVTNPLPTAVTVTEIGSPGKIANALPVNAAPTDITFNNSVITIVENASITGQLKVADLQITDDALGNNVLSLSGVDANIFELQGTELFLKAATVLNFDLKPNLVVAVNVDDLSVGATPDVVKVFTLKLTDTSNLVAGTTGADQLEVGITPGLTGISDRLFTGAGNDTVDTAIGGVVASNNRIDTGSGNDVIFIADADRAFGGTGDDEFEATEAKNYRAAGGAGNNTFFLGTNGRVLGGDGNDKFFVGTGGGNLLSGGAGVDQFWIASSDIPTAANTVLDFQVGTDVIGLQGVGANATNVVLAQVGADTSIAFGGQTLAILKGIQSSSLNPGNPGQFVFA